MDRRHRDVAARDRREVGAGLVLVAGVGAVDPVLAPRALLVLEAQLVAVDALAQPRDLDALGVDARNVDVEQRARGQGHLVEALDDVGDELRRGGEVELAPEAEVHLACGGLLRDREGRQPEDHALQRRGHRPGVRDVVAEVRTVVDPGDDRLGLEALDQPELGQPHAVDRRAVGRVAVGAVVEVDTFDPQRPAGGDRARHGAAIAVRRDDRQLDAVEPHQRAAQRLQAVGHDPVVVGEQDAHGVSH